MNRLRTGGMLTEFDVAQAGPSNLTSSSLRTSDVGRIATMEIADEHMISWIGWEFKKCVAITGSGHSIYNPDGTINYDCLATLTRTYPQAVAGRT